MTGNDSSTGGYLAPSPPPITDDVSLEVFLQAIVVAITSLPGNMVRPRWQPEPPNLPDYGTDWCAIGITNSTPDTFAYEDDTNVGAEQGGAEFQRNEVFDLDCSFYGPNDDGFADTLRDGLAVAQNREVLFLNAMGLVGVGERVRGSELIKGRWLRRADLTVTFRRQIRRTYQVLSFLSSAGAVSDGTHSSPFEAAAE